MRTLALATICSLAVLVGSCATPDGSCPAVGGVFQPLYTPLTANCQPMSTADIFLVPFDGGTSGNNTIVQNLGTIMLTTEIVMKGCTIRMTQEAVQMGSGALTKIDGDILKVDNANQVSGTVTYSQIDATGQVCSDLYSAQFKKNVQQLGGAASLPTGISN